EHREQPGYPGGGASSLVREIVRFGRSEIGNRCHQLLQAGRTPARLLVSRERIRFDAEGEILTVRTQPVSVRMTGSLNDCVGTWAQVSCGPPDKRPAWLSAPRARAR